MNNSSFTLPPVVLRLLMVLATVQLIRTVMPPDLDSMLIFFSASIYSAVDSLIRSGCMAR